MNPLGILNDVNAFIQRSQRVFTVSYRPTDKEFWAMARTTGLGIVLVGLIGFVITLVFSLI